MNSHCILVPTDFSAFEEKSKKHKGSSVVEIQRFSHGVP